MDPRGQPNDENTKKKYGVMTANGRTRCSRGVGCVCFVLCCFVYPHSSSLFLKNPWEPVVIKPPDTQTPQKRLSKIWYIRAFDIKLGPGGLWRLAGVNSAKNRVRMYHSEEAGSPGTPNQSKKVNVALRSYYEPRLI